MPRKSMRLLQKKREKYEPLRIAKEKIEHMKVSKY
jgi:hypothetical protein